MVSPTATQEAARTLVVAERHRNRGSPCRSPFCAGSLCWWGQKRTIDPGRQVSEGIMTPDEFRVGRSSVDRLDCGLSGHGCEPARDGAHRAGRGQSSVPRCAAGDAGGFRGSVPRPREDHSSRPFALAAPQLFWLLPGQFVARQRAGRLSQHRPGRTGAVMAIESGPHRTGGSGHRLGSPDGGPFQHLEWRDPGHGLHQHPGRPPLRGSGRRVLP